MLNKKSVFIFLMFLIPLTALFSFDSDYLNRVTFINKTGADIWYIFLSPADSGEWGFDILGSERMLEDNNLLSFFIIYPDHENNFDIMAIDEDGNTFILFEETISDDEEANIIITESDLDSDDPGMEFLTVEFTNETDYEMYYIFVSPGDSNMWGVDMMDDEQTLGPYETLSLLAPYRDDVVLYDVMAVDEEDDEYILDFGVHADLSDDDWVISVSIEYDHLME